MKKILIISSNRLGDCILSSGIIEYYKRKDAEINITFVCGPIPGSLFRFCRNIDRLIILKKRKYSFHWFYLWFLLFLTPWNDILDLRGTAISYFLFAKKRTIYKNNKIDENEHKVKVISRKVCNKILHPSINIDQKNHPKKSKLVEVKKLKKTNKLVVLAPSANWIGKIWPIERFSQLINELKKSRFFKNAVFLIIGPLEEKILISELLKRNKSEILDLVGKTDLAEIFLIMKQCAIFIGNDSGLMHLAALSGIPTVGLFGPSDAKRYHPWGTETLAISSLKTPEQLMGYQGFDHKKCGSLMLDLEVKVVLKKIIEFYSKYQ